MVIIRAGIREVALVMAWGLWGWILRVERVTGFSDPPSGGLHQLFKGLRGGTDFLLFVY